MYPEIMVIPMREELTRAGIKEARTAEEVDAALAKPGTTMLVVNSICGCAAGKMRPGVRLAFQNTNLPDQAITVFAGQDREATERARSYFDGNPPTVMNTGSAWPGANFELIDKTTEVSPGMTLLALVSDAPGTKELKELSLAINTPEGIVLIVGCSHPGIDAIVTEAAKINTHIHFVAGGLHLPAAPDSVISPTRRRLSNLSSAPSRQIIIRRALIGGSSGAQ